MHEQQQNAEKQQQQSDAYSSRLDSMQNVARPPLPHDLTAEWTVRAELTFARAGEAVRREYSTNDPVNPVRVVYKWTNLDDNAAPPNHESVEKPTTLASSRWSRHSTPLKPTSSMGRSQSFRSTTSSVGQTTAGEHTAPTDSAFGSTNGFRQAKKAPKNTTNGIEGATSAAYYGTRCQSTCNIVVSAVADFLPPEAYGCHLPGTVTSSTSAATDYILTEEEPDPYTFNTNASYTVLPQKSFDEYSSSATPNRSAFGRVLALVDAMCQTSDTETKYYEELESKRQQSVNSSRQKQQQPQQHSRKYYDQRRATEETLPVPETDEVHNNLPSYAATSSQTFKSASTSRLAGLAGFPYIPQPASKTSTEGQKKPRTVHIDVYCTGSEDDQADVESSSSESDAGRHYEIESNSTPKTVLDTEEMHLRHQRISSKQLPRRLVQQQPQKDNLETKPAVSQEISESKQLLFRKHIGDQRAAKLQALRQKYIRQSSEEASSYANSSRSTVRDVTGSSVHSEMVDGIAEETNTALTKSDSFDYDNSLDRLRIKRMERFWSRSLGSSGYNASFEDQQHEQMIATEKSQHYQTPSHLQTISERNSSLQRFDTLSENEQISELTSNVSPTYQFQQQVSSSPIDSPTADEPYQQHTSFLRHRPGFLQFFGPAPQMSSSAPVQASPMRPEYTSEAVGTSIRQPNITPLRTRWQSETRETSVELTKIPLMQRSPSEAPSIVYTQNKYQSPTFARRFDMYRDSPASVKSELSTCPPGYTLEHLEKARKFGKVVTARKPGHHVGPTKNPNCACESCQRWLAERFQIRGRAFSLGESPVLKRPIR